ncbi:hypothetical protein [Paraburkholderia ultramafica]|uniref:hypothetical protein n=1 Tax=Paraburkholderia ultramafica TaxID=1544867 RepID=UPI0015834CEC|nr:hypothetical protein [Paraburkholderia ultramafica]
MSSIQLKYAIAASLPGSQQTAPDNHLMFFKGKTRKTRPPGTTWEQSYSPHSIVNPRAKPCVDGFFARLCGVDTVSNTKIPAWHLMAFTGAHQKINARSV